MPRDNQDDTGSRNFWIMLQLIVAGKISFPLTFHFLLHKRSLAAEGGQKLVAVFFASIFSDRR